MILFTMLVLFIVLFIFNMRANSRQYKKIIAAFQELAGRERGRSDIAVTDIKDEESSPPTEEEEALEESERIGRDILKIIRPRGKIKNLTMSDIGDIATAPYRKHINEELAKSYNTSKTAISAIRTTARGIGIDNERKVAPCKVENTVLEELGDENDVSKYSRGRDILFSIRKSGRLSKIDKTQISYKEVEEIADAEEKTVLLEKRFGVVGSCISEIRKAAGRNLQGRNTLTIEDVKKILASPRRLRSHREMLANKFGVCVGTIEAIHSGKTWKRIPRDKDYSSYLEEGN